MTVNAITKSRTAATSSSSRSQTSSTRRSEKPTAESKAAARLVDTSKHTFKAVDADSSKWQSAEVSSSNLPASARKLYEGHTDGDWQPMAYKTKVNGQEVFAVIRPDSDGPNGGKTKIDLFKENGTKFLSGSGPTPTSGNAFEFNKWSK